MNRMIQRGQDSLFYPPCPIAVARHVARVLKPGGTLFAAMGGGLLVPDKEIVWFVFVRQSTL